MKLWTTRSVTTNRLRRRRSKDLRRAVFIADLRRLAQRGLDLHRHEARIADFQSTIWLDKLPNNVKARAKDDVKVLGPLYDDWNARRVAAGFEAWPARGNA